jgi:hypothetical protein
MLMRAVFAIDVARCRNRYRDRHSSSAETSARISTGTTPHVHVHRHAGVGDGGRLISRAIAAASPHRGRFGTLTLCPALRQLRGVDVDQLETGMGMGMGTGTTYNVDHILHVPSLAAVAK